MLTDMTKEELMRYLDQMNIHMLRRAAYLFFFRPKALKRQEIVDRIVQNAYDPKVGPTKDYKQGLLDLGFTESFFYYDNTIRAGLQYILDNPKKKGRVREYMLKVRPARPRDLRGERTPDPLEKYGLRLPMPEPPDEPNMQPLYGEHLTFLDKLVLRMPLYVDAITAQATLCTTNSDRKRRRRYDTWQINQIITTGRLKKDFVDKPEKFQMQFEGVCQFDDRRSCGIAFGNDFCRGAKNSFYVGMNAIRQYRLEMGDHIVATCTCAPNKGMPYVDQVHTINGIPADQIERKRFLDLPNAPATTALQGSATVFDSNVLAGQCVVAFKGDVADDNNPTPSATLAQQIAENNSEQFVIYIKAGGKKLKIKQTPNFVTAFATDDKDCCTQNDVAELAFLHACRRVELGQKVVVVVDDLLQLCHIYADAYNLDFSLTEQYVTILQQAKTLLGLAKNVQDGGSLTFVAFAQKPQTEIDKIVLQELQSVASVVHQTIRNV